MDTRSGHAQARRGFDGDESGGVLLEDYPYVGGGDSLG